MAAGSVLITVHMSIHLSLPHYCCTSPAGWITLLENTTILFSGGGEKEEKNALLLSPQASAVIRLTPIKLSPSSCFIFIPPSLPSSSYPFCHFSFALSLSLFHSCAPCPSAAALLTSVPLIKHAGVKLRPLAIYRASTVPNAS